MQRKFANEVSEQIYQYLIDMILSREIKPGDRIPEVAIAQQFQISRTPIREALRELAKDGIINTYPNRFSEVAVYDDDRVREIGITKICLDRLSVKLASYFGCQADYDNLRLYARKCYEAAEREDLLNRIKADSDYHWNLCKMGKNRSLMQMENGLIIQIEYLQAANYLQAEDPKVQYQFHMKIAEALEQRNLEVALQAITEPSVLFYDLKSVPAYLYQ